MVWVTYKVAMSEDQHMQDHWTKQLGRNPLIQKKRSYFIVRHINVFLLDVVQNYFSLTKIYITGQTWYLHSLDLKHVIRSAMHRKLRRKHSNTKERMQTTQLKTKFNCHRSQGKKRSLQIDLPTISLLSD